MTLEINPVVPQGRQLIQAYGDKRFRIAGEVYEGSVVVFPEKTFLHAPLDGGAVDLDALKPITEAAADVDLVLVGCGATFLPVPKGLRGALKDAGIVLEWMDTGAACRTFNVLLAEERRIAAALIAVD